MSCDPIKPVAPVMRIRLFIYSHIAIGKINNRAVENVELPKNVMHSIEPYFNWRHLYVASEDERSPFFGYQNSEVYYTDHIYNYVIHPQWDFIGCETLFVKLLYTDYSKGFAIIELLGEWNDVLHNDVMFLKRDMADPLMEEGISKFILLGDNLLNFHGGETDYYEEWLDDLENGWIVAVNFREHILHEHAQYYVDQYLISGGELDDINWRKFKPPTLYSRISSVVERRLGM